MKFQQFVPEYNAELRKIIFGKPCPNKPDTTAEDVVLWMQTHTEEIFIRSKRPYYRMYPGVTEALTRLGIEKHDISKVRPPVNPLSLEFPVDSPLIAGDRKIVNILFMEFAEEDDNSPFVEDCLFIEYRSHVDTFGVITFSREYDEIMRLVNSGSEAEAETYKVVLQIVFGVCMIPQSDTSLITPRVLNRDLEKFEATGDIKFVERAKRNGVIGWDVGRDIPTLEEMESLRQQGEAGRKSPHWRMGHFALRHTGEGRVDKKVVWIKETFINKNLLKEVPHGYHDKEKIGDS